MPTRQSASCRVRERSLNTVCSTLSRTVTIVPSNLPTSSATVMHIPLIQPDLPPFEAVEGPFREILANGKITNFGQYVRQFEKSATDYLGVHTVTVSSGTMAMNLTM